MAFLGVSFTMDETTVAGDSVAYALTRGTGRIVGKDTGSGSPECSRELFVLGRRDGAWKGRPLHVQPATVTVPLHFALPIT